MELDDGILKTAVLRQKSDEECISQITPPPGNWQLIEDRVKEFTYCQEPAQDPLVHYLLVKTSVSRLPSKFSRRCVNQLPRLLQRIQDYLHPGELRAR